MKLRSKCPILSPGVSDPHGTLRLPRKGESMYETSFGEHWASVYWMLEPFDAAFDYSVAMRIGEDAVLMDGQMFYSTPF